MNYPQFGRAVVRPPSRIDLRRNILVQALGIGMVTLVCLGVLPWLVVASWTAVVIGLAATEHFVLRLASNRPRPERIALWPPALRVMLTSTYAVAALALIVAGGPGERLFAFALMTGSMVHVLMRHYRSLVVLMASLSPYLLVLGLVGLGLSRSAFQQGNAWGLVASLSTVGILGVQLWSARAQLAGSWQQLLTARREAEKRQLAAEAANRAKSEFLATMSHELRTPLNAVLGMVQVLSEDALTQRQKEHLKVIRRSSESLLAVLNDLLDLSKIEAHALDLELTEFDLGHLVRGVVAAYRALGEKKGLTFDFEVTAEARGKYVGDSARIRRVLYSLCENAVKFTHEGGITLLVDRGPNGVVLRVSDTGIGIADHDLKCLFAGFFQADSSLTRKHGGAGVGLSICQELTKLMGGSLEVSSAPGAGSTFTVVLPLDLAPEPKAQMPVAEAPEQEALPEIRVLAAEDNPTNQLVLKLLLAQGGVEPSLVVNGQEALAAWEHEHWDLILMDIQMPCMSGVEATLAIRAREALTGRRRTPIVAVTANAMTHQIAEYKAAGMDGVVSKPVSLANLFEVMEEALAAGDPCPSTIAIAPEHLASH